MLVSCQLSPAGIRFLDILFPPENSALLTVGLPGRHQGGPDSVGVPMFRTHEMRPGWVPPLPRGGGVLPTGAASPIGACRFPPAELLITGHTKIHLRSPVRSSPRPSPPGGTGALRLSPWASHPAVTHDARQDGDGPTDTGPDHILLPTSNRCDHSSRATSRRTAAPSSTPPLRRRSNGGLSPPSETTAPHGARSAWSTPPWSGYSCTSSATCGATGCSTPPPGAGRSPQPV